MDHSPESGGEMKRTIIVAFTAYLLTALLPGQETKAGQLP
jgi:hypothetical protein